MDIANLVLEFLKVLLSPQIIAGIVGTVLIVVFREDIRALLRRDAKIRLPGGFELSTSQAARTSEVGSSIPNPPETPKKVPVSLPQGVTLPPDQVEKVRQAFQAEQARASLWEYRYLNLFLVFRTQSVLDWLAALKDRATIGLFDTIWLPVIPDLNERKAVLQALQAHNLVELDGPLISVTPKGFHYLSFRGPLSPLPKVPT